MYGVLLIIVLVITGGAIAFVGDRLGSRVGKKRISLFGLRPKHTSILVTIITGVLITSSSIGIMAVASDNVRTALFGMEKLHQEMEKTKEQLLIASQDLEQARTEQKSADIALNQAREGLHELQGQMYELQERNDNLLEGNAELERAKYELMERYDILSATNGELLLEQAELRAGNDKLQGENKDLEERNKDLRDGIVSMREGEIVFRAGEVLAYETLRGGRSEEDIKLDLQSLMAKAQENSYLSLTQRSSTEVTPDDVQFWIYPPDFEAAVQKIAQSDYDIIVQVVTVSNLLKGEGLRVTLELYRNAQIYTDGMLVLSKEIKLDGTVKTAEDGVVQFLKDVNDAAIKKGMVPDRLTGAIGVIDGNQVFNVLKQLESVNGTAVLYAHANGNTNTLGPLRIILKVGL